MSKIGPNGNKTRLHAFVVFMLSVQILFGQNALTSVKINIQDVKISKDLKTISYDVYLQDVDTTYKIAVPGYGVQLAVPTADLDPLKAKTVSITNPCPLIGVRLPTMIVNGSNWVMKFQNSSSPLSYDAALLLSETFPGTHLATFNITNTNGSAFTNPQQFTATFAGTSPSTKTSISVFLQDLVSLAPNSTAAQPATNFTGLGVYTLTATAAAPLIITGVAASNKVYDGTVNATLTGGTLVGAVAEDVVSFVAGSGAFSDKNVGTSKVVNATGYSLNGTDASKYVLSAQPSGITANITAKALSVSAPTITLNKFYDGTANAMVTAGTMSGIVDADVPNVSLSATATYDNAFVGTGKSITVKYSLSGSASGNYISPANYSVSNGIITESAGYQLTVSAPTITLSKTYDGTTSAVVTAGTMSGVLAADVSNVTLHATANYDNASVGTGKTITVTYSLSGSAAGNYLAPSNLTLSNGIIFSKTLTVSNPTITLSKIYDGTANAVVSAGTLSDILISDASNVMLNASASYSTASVGMGKTITVKYSLSGSASGNYIAPANSTVSTGVILLKPLTVSAPSLTLSKSYDGTTSADVITGSLSGVLTADASNVILTATAYYSTATVGTGKAITITYSLSGSAMGNYVVPSNFTVSNGVILSKILTVSTPTIVLSKIYDGTTRAVVMAGTLSGVLTAETADVNLNAAASYDNASIGLGKTITVTYSLSGTAASNYTPPVKYSVSNGIISDSIGNTLSSPTLSSLEIYPNPTIDGFFVNAGEEVGNLLLFDLSGRKLLTKKVSGKTYVDISYLAKGIYFVYLRGVQVKIVKN